jgi:hypothetical protein
LQSQIDILPWKENLQESAQSASSAFHSPDEARRQILLTRYLAHAGPVTLDAVRARYAFPPTGCKPNSTTWSRSARLAHGRFTPDAAGGLRRSSSTAARWSRCTAAR